MYKSYTFEEQSGWELKPPLPVTRKEIMYNKQKVQIRGLFDGLRNFRDFSSWEVGFIYSMWHYFKYLPEMILSFRQEETLEKIYTKYVEEINQGRHFPFKNAAILGIPRIEKSVLSGRLDTLSETLSAHNHRINAIAKSREGINESITNLSRQLDLQNLRILGLEKKLEGSTRLLIYPNVESQVSTKEEPQHGRRTKRPVRKGGKKVSKAKSPRSRSSKR